MDFSFPITPDISIAFATPVLVRSIPNFEAVNAGLIEQILAAQENDTGVSVSNRGGWQSSPTLWNWETPEIVSTIAKKLKTFNASPKTTKSCS